MPPSLSVIVAVTHDSDTLHPLLERLAPQLEVFGGELLIADGSRDGLNGIDVAVHSPGADVFALRAAACEHVAAELVTFTEDHCLPAGNWCEAILEAHRRHPDRAAVAGCVINGSTDTATDWANFLMTFAPFLPPLPPRTGSRVAPAANVSFKTEVLRAHDVRPGFVELELLPHLQRVGHVVYDDSVEVAHVQPRGRLEAIGHHFHNGRCTTGLQDGPRPAGETLRRVARSPLLPVRLVAHVLREIVARGRFRRPAIRALPWLFLLAVAHTVGEDAGLLFGPGRSPERLE